MNRRLHRAHLPLVRLLQPLSFSSPHCRNQTVATEQLQPNTEQLQPNPTRRSIRRMFTARRRSCWHARRAHPPACACCWAQERMPRCLTACSSATRFTTQVGAGRAGWVAAGCAGQTVPALRTAPSSAACLNCAPPHPAAALYGCAEAVDALLDDHSLVATAAGQPQQLLRDALLADSQGHHRWGSIEFTSAYFTVVRKRAH